MFMNFLLFLYKLHRRETYDCMYVLFYSSMSILIYIFLILITTCEVDMGQLLFIQVDTEGEDGKGLRR